MRRVFIPPAWIHVGNVAFPAGFGRRLAALGLDAGSHMIVLDDTGWEYEVEFTHVASDGASAQVVHRRLAAGERRTKISLYQGLVSPQLFELILRRGTELGIVEFVPIACDRCQMPDLGTFDEAMLEAWGEGIVRAAEATERGRLPRLRPATLFDAGLDQATRRGTALIIWEGEGSRDIRMVTGDRPFAIHLISPPPAGFTASEVDRAERHGAVAVRPPYDPAGDTPVGLLTSQAIFEQLG
jgi:16S rRNA (uracil1498-N3)-methyltransferase